MAVINVPCQGYFEDMHLKRIMGLMNGDKYIVDTKEEEYQAGFGTGYMLEAKERDLTKERAEAQSAQVLDILFPQRIL